MPEHPGKTYTATVESSSQAVNVASGTTLMQLAVDNARGELLPGGFANVSLDLPRNASALSVPASALIFDKAGLRVATVGADNKVVLKTVTIARDLGKVIELGSGLAPTTGHRESARRRRRWRSGAHCGTCEAVGARCGEGQRWQGLMHSFR